MRFCASFSPAGSSTSSSDGIGPVCCRLSEGGEDDGFPCCTTGAIRGSGKIPFNHPAKNFPSFRLLVPAPLPADAGSPPPVHQSKARQFQPQGTGKAAPPPDRLTPNLSLCINPAFRSNNRERGNTLFGQGENLCRKKSQKAGRFWRWVPSRRSSSWGIPCSSPFCRK